MTSRKVRRTPRDLAKKLRRKLLCGKEPLLMKRVLCATSYDVNEELLQILTEALEEARNGE